MKKILFFLLVLVCFRSFAQTGNDTTKYLYYKYQYGQRMARVQADTVLGFPKDTAYSKFGLAIKNGTLYFGNGTLWTSVGASAGVFYDSTLMASRKLLVDSSNNKLRGIIRRSDSVFALIGSSLVYQFKDSTGGGGSVNTSVGGGYRLIVVGGNQVKSFTTGAFIKLDTSVSGTINVIVDSAAVFTWLNTSHPFKVPVTGPLTVRPGSGGASDTLDCPTCAAGVATASYTNIAAMLAASRPADSTVVLVPNYYNNNDFVVTEWQWFASSTTTADNMTVLGTGTGRYKLVIRNNRATFKQLGVFKSSDNTTGMTAANAWASPRGVTLVIDDWPYVIDPAVGIPLLSNMHWVGPGDSIYSVVAKTWTGYNKNMLYNTSMVTPADNVTFEGIGFDTKQRYNSATHAFAAGNPSPDTGSCILRNTLGSNMTVTHCAFKGASYAGIFASTVIGQNYDYVTGDSLGRCLFMNEWDTSGDYVVMNHIRGHIGMKDHYDANDPGPLKIRAGDDVIFWGHRHLKIINSTFTNPYNMTWVWGELVGTGEGLEIGNITQDAGGKTGVGFSFGGNFNISPPAMLVNPWIHDIVDINIGAPLLRSTDSSGGQQKHIYPHAIEFSNTLNARLENNFFKNIYFLIGNNNINPVFSGGAIDNSDINATTAISGAANLFTLEGHRAGYDTVRNFINRIPSITLNSGKMYKWETGTAQVDGWKTEGVTLTLKGVSSVGEYFQPSSGHQHLGISFNNFNVKTTSTGTLYKAFYITDALGTAKIDFSNNDLSGATTFDTTDLQYVWTLPAIINKENTKFSWGTSTKHVLTVNSTAPDGAGNVVVSGSGGLDTALRVAANLVPQVVQPSTLSLPTSDGASVLKVSPTLWFGMVQRGSVVDFTGTTLYSFLYDGKNFTNTTSTFPSGLGSEVTIGNPNLCWNAAKDSIICLFFGYHGTGGSIATIYRMATPRTNLGVFTTPTTVFTGSYFVGSYDRILKSSKGIYYMPYDTCTNADLSTPTGRYHGRLLTSANAITWTRTSVNLVPGADSLWVESGIIEYPVRRDGLYSSLNNDSTKLIWYARSRSGYLPWSESFDRGVTWSAPYSSNLAVPNSTVTLKTFGQTIYFGGNTPLINNGVSDNDKKKELVLRAFDGYNWTKNTIIAGTVTPDTAYHEASLAFDSTTLLVLYSEIKKSTGYGALNAQSFDRNFWSTGIRGTTTQSAMTISGVGTTPANGGIAPTLTFQGSDGPAAGNLRITSTTSDLKRFGADISVKGDPLSSSIGVGLTDTLSAENYGQLYHGAWWFDGEAPGGGPLTYNPIINWGTGHVLKGSIDPRGNISTKGKYFLLGTVYDTTTGAGIRLNGTSMEYKDFGGSWTAFSAGGGGGSSTLAGLTDVAVTSPSDGDMIKYVSGTSKWTKFTPSFSSSYGDGLANVSGTVRYGRTAQGTGAGDFGATTYVTPNTGGLSYLFGDFSGHNWADVQFLNTQPIVSNTAATTNWKWSNIETNTAFYNRIEFLRLEGAGNYSLTAGTKVGELDFNTNAFIGGRSTGSGALVELYHRIYTGSGYVDAQVWKPSGQSKLGAYGSGTFTGTVAYVLGVTSSGDVVETSAGGGSGTVTSFGKTDGFGITSSVANSTTTPVHTIAIDSAAVFSAYAGRIVRTTASTDYTISLGISSLMYLYSSGGTAKTITLPDPSAVPNRVIVVSVSGSSINVAFATTSGTANFYNNTSSQGTTFATNAIRVFTFKSDGTDWTFY